MFALTYLLKGRRWALVGLPVITCAFVQDTSKAAGWHRLLLCQYRDSILWEKGPWYNCVRLFEPCRRRQRNSRLDLRSHLAWWARMRLIELSHKSADRMSGAEKELKFGSWRRELARDRSGKEMIWGYIGPSESNFSPPTSLEKERALSCSIYYVPRTPLAAISVIDMELKWPKYTGADGQNHWHPALVTSDDRLFVSSCPDLHFCSSGAFILWSAASALLHTHSFPYIPLSSSAQHDPWGDKVAFTPDPC